MMLFIYNLVLLILLPLMVTRIIIKGLKDRDYLSNFLNRFGLYREASRENLIWFHAVSLGEVIGSEQLVRKFINELYGNKEGFSRGKAGSMHLYDKKVGFYGSSPIVGNIIPLGVGIALSNKLKKNNKIVIIFFGDGATEEGVFYESLNFASIHKLLIEHLALNLKSFFC